MESDALWMQLKEKMESLSSSQLSCAKQHTLLLERIENDYQNLSRKLSEMEKEQHHMAGCISTIKGERSLQKTWLPFLMTFLVGLNAFFLYRIDARLDLVKDKAAAIEAKQSNNIFERRTAVKSLEERIMRIEEILKR